MSEWINCPKCGASMENMTRCEACKPEAPPIPIAQPEAPPPEHPVVPKRRGRPPKDRSLSGEAAPKPKPKIAPTHNANSVPTYIKTEQEYLAELLVTDPVIKGLDDKIVERKASKKDGVLTDLMKEKQQALSKLHHAAKSLANVIFKVQGARLMVRSRASVTQLRYEKQKRIRYLKSQARKMKEEAAKKASSLYYKKFMSNKKVSPPGQA